MVQINYQRKSDLLKKVFRQYLFPMIILNLATSLNEFADSIIVSGLIGEAALAIVNMGMPLILVYTMIALLIGVGGSTEYARSVGERRIDNAEKNYTISVLILMAISAIVTVIAYLFAGQIAGAMTNDTAVAAVLAPYLRLLSLTAVPFIMVTGLSYFLTAAGEPKLATVIIIVANVINIGMDVVYIRVLDLGVNGAALATVTGYAVALLVLIVLMCMKKSSLRFHSVGKSEIKIIILLMTTGIAVALGQLGLACKIYSINFLAGQYGGTNGVVVFSLCIQTLSIVCVFLCGISQCVMPIVSTLSGEEDNQGIKIIVNYGTKCLLGVVLVLVLIFVTFPQIITTIYSIREPEVVAMAHRGIRLFSLTHLLRSFCIMLMMYYSAVGKKKIAFICSMLDSFVVIPIAIILCIQIGLDGIWIAFPISSILVMIYIFAAAQRENKKTEGETKGIFLLRVKNKEAVVCNFTVQSSYEDAVALSGQMIDFMLLHGCTSKLANEVGVVAEEMIAYIVDNSSKNTCIDILLKIFSKRICIYFRNDGKPLSALNAIAEKDNIMEMNSKKLLHILADEVKYERVLGMNSTRIVLKY